MVGRRHPGQKMPRPGLRSLRELRLSPDAVPPRDVTEVVAHRYLRPELER